MKFTITNRLVQYAFAIIALILSAILVKDRSSLSSIVGDVNGLLSGNATASDYTDVIQDILNATGSTSLSATDISGSYPVRRSNGLIRVGAEGYSSSGSSIAKRDGTSLFSNVSLDGNIKPIALSLGSGSLTTFGNGGLYLLNKIGMKSPTMKISNVNARMFGISKRQISYLSSLAGSEMGSVVLWFVSFVYQTASSGSWDCGDASSLLQHYNLTGNNEGDTSLSNFFDISPDSSQSNSTLASILAELQDNGSGSQTNLTRIETQTRLLLKLSSNCKTRKATIAISCLGSLTYLLSSALLTSSGFMLYTNLKKMRSDGKSDGGSSSNETADELSDYTFVYSDPLLFPELKATARDQKEEKAEA